MTLVNVLAIAASYTAVASIGAFGLIVFGALCVGYIKNKPHFA